MKLSIKVATLILLFSAKMANAQFIHVLYGELKPGQQQILDRVFKPRLIELEKLDQVKEVVQKQKATYLDLLRALKSPETIGVIYLGHPAIKTEGTFPNKNIIHGYLMDSDGRYLPKNIFSSVHPNLKFLSIMTCHESAVLPLYLKSLPDFVHYYKSPTHNMNSLGNPLFEFTSFYSTPKILEEIERDMDRGRYDDFKIFPDPTILTLNLKVMDLVSSRFSYVVTLNDKLIGALFSKKNDRGRLINKASFSFDIQQSDLKDKNVLKIYPDDSNRPRPKDLKVIDDIILSEVYFNNGENLIGMPIHIGDQELDPDLLDGLGFLRNRSEFTKSDFMESWEWVW
ncbi:MAG: hypothetical protein K9K67_16060 [Bacteriovoracaceae bacterium]|nr:hypothetical protein [Bacteriovoracaceae bacterium]